MYEKDRRIVITLDAGGTNFVFGAVQGDRFVVEPITLPSNSDRLDPCLETMVEGFRTVIGRLPEQPAAISFAFPGPADYPRGIIGGYLPNFPSFRDGVALKDFLEERFGIPTFINNDGDLYAYGEALAGALPEINARLEAAGSAKRFRNLIGYTWGTGFGVGIVSDNRLHIGDNSCVETFCLRHKDLPDINVEEGVSIRAVKRLYAEYAGVDDDTLDPKAIFEIAEASVKASDKLVTYENGDQTRYLDLLFICHPASEGNAVPRVNDDESLEVGWFKPDALPQPLAASTIERLAYVKRYRENTAAGNPRALFSSSMPCA